MSQTFSFEENLFESCNSSNSKERVKLSLESKNQPKTLYKTQYSRWKAENVQMADMNSEQVEKIKTKGLDGNWKCNQIKKSCSSLN